MTDFIEVYDNALSPQLCEQIMQVFAQSPHKQTGRTGGGVDTSKKISEDLYLQQHPEYQQLVQQLQQITRSHMIEYVKKYHFMLIAPIALQVRHPQRGNPVNLTHENFAELAAGKEGSYLELLFRLGGLQAQKYAAGEGNYNYWHCENYPAPNTVEPLHRTLLFMYYLNDVAEGGETDFYYQEKSIQPQQGRMVIAPAYFTHTHRGRTPISNDKYIITSWVLFNPAEAIFRR